MMISLAMTSIRSCSSPWTFSLPWAPRTSSSRARRTLLAIVFPAREIAEMIQGEDIDEYARLVKLGLAATDWHKRVHKLATQLDKRRPFSCLETVVQTVEKLAV